MHIGFIGYFSLEAPLSWSGIKGEDLFCVIVRLLATITKCLRKISFKKKYIFAQWFWRKGMTQES